VFHEQPGSPCPYYAPQVFAGLGNCAKIEKHTPPERKIRETPKPAANNGRYRYKINAQLAIDRTPLLVNFCSPRNAVRLFDFILRPPQNTRTSEVARESSFRQTNGNHRSTIINVNYRSRPTIEFRAFFRPRISPDRRSSRGKHGGRPGLLYPFRGKVRETVSRETVSRS